VIRSGAFRLCVVGGLLIPAAYSQEPNTGSSVIRSESRLVLVDTVVTDKKGNYDRSLTQKDFRVFEDNKEQVITSFSLESGSEERSRKHYTILFFDDATAGPAQAYARQAAAQFIDSNAGPNRPMAIAEFMSELRVTQNFTEDADKLKQAVAGVRFSGGSGAATQAPARGRGRDAGASPDTYATRNFLRALQDVAQNLAGTPGRKTLVLISRGFPSSQDTLADINNTIAVFNRANVGIYTVGSSQIQASGHGQDEVGGDASSSGGGQRGGRRGGSGAAGAFDMSETGAQQALNTLASGTGGFAIQNSNDLFSGFEKIGKEQDSYYMLGYTPAKDLQPGACHTLKVKIDKSGDSVRARPSYCEARPLDVLSGTTAERDLEAHMTANASPTITGASMTVPFFYTAANTARVHVALEVPAGTMEFVKEKGKFRAAMNVVGMAWLPDGTVRGRFSDSVKLSFDDNKEVDAFRARPFLYEKQFPIGPGKYNFRLVFSSAAKQFGRVEAPLNIEPWEPKEFALSGLALVRSVHQAKESLGGLDVEVVDDRAALVANGVEMTPTGSNHFRRSEKAYIYAEIYEPAMTAIGVHMELLEAGGGKVVRDFGLTRVRVPEVTGTQSVPVGLILNAPEVAAGTYTLRITAMDAANRQAVRTVDVVLEN